MFQYSHTLKYYQRLVQHQLISTRTSTLSQNICKVIYASALVGLKLWYVPIIMESRDTDSTTEETSCFKTRIRFVSTIVTSNVISRSSPFAIQRLS